MKRKKPPSTRGFFVFEAPPLGLISNQVYEGFAQPDELRAFTEYDGNYGIMLPTKSSHSDALKKQENTT
jgi:hypothetical protein